MNLLVVDDDDSVLRAIVRMVRQHANVSSATSVAEAKALLARSEFDALIVDLLLNDGSGFEVIERAQRSTPAIRTLVVTGRSDREAANRAFDVGADYLVKPFDAAQLVRFLQQVETTRTSGLYRIGAVVALRQNEFGLTVREAEILHLAATGTGRAQLADALGCEESTIKSHVNKLLRKTRHNSLLDAVADVLRRVASKD